MPSKQSHGFTLFELLIAIAIFSLLSAMSFAGLKSVLDGKEQAEKQLARLADIQRAFFVLSNDIEQMTNRATRDELGSEYPALTGGQNIDATIISFTRGGWQNPANLPRSDLQRVAYGFEDGSLIRLHWFHVDHLQASEPIRRELLTKVEQVQVKYYTEKENSDVWPPLNATQTSDETNASVLPVAIEVTLVLSDWGEVSRLFRIPGG